MLTIAEKVKPIRLLILDIDGVLSSGVIYYANEETIVKGFHVHDGLGMKLLQKSGVEIAIISAKTTLGVVKRLAELNIRHSYLNQENKMHAFNELKKKLGLENHEIAYMGDDLPDLPILKRVGLPITVPDAPEIIREAVIFITQKNAGLGAVREVCDAILKIQGNYETIIKEYLHDTEKSSI